MNRKCMSAEDNKLQHVSLRLGLDDSVSQYEALCVFVVNSISFSVGFKTYLNCISGKLICDVLQHLTRVKLTASNLCTYKKNGFDLAGDVAKLLKVPIVSGIRYELNVTDNRLFITPKSDAPSQALKTIMAHGGLPVREILYQKWQTDGTYLVGDKRNWPSPKLFELLKLYPSLLIQAPVSHDTPVRHGRLLKHLSRTLTSSKPETINQAYLELIIHEFCQSDIKKHRQTSSWLPSLEGIATVRYVEKLTPDVRQSPYFYIRTSLSTNGSKIGSADRSNNRVSLNDLGVIVALNSRAESGDALRIESIVRRELANYNIHPVDGKKDHYAMPLEKLAKLVLTILANKKSLHHLLHGVTATLSTQ